MTPGHFRNTERLQSSVPPSFVISKSGPQDVLLLTSIDDGLGFGASRCVGVSLRKRLAIALQATHQQVKRPVWLSARLAQDRHVIRKPTADGLGLEQIRLIDARTTNARRCFLQRHRQASAI